MTLAILPLPSPLFSASKWGEISVLLSFSDWQKVLHFLEGAFLFSLKNPVEKELIVTKEMLEKGYKEALYALEKKEDNFSSWVHLLPVAASLDSESFFLSETPSKKKLIQWRRPAILIQPFFFHYSSLDEIFRPKILGKEKIFWGMQFSFPYIYYDPLLKEVKKVDLKEEKNGSLFVALRRLIRTFTKKALFTKGKGGDFRISETGLKTILPHFQLQDKGIYVR